MYSCDRFSIESSSSFVVYLERDRIVEVDELRTYSESIDDGLVASLPGIVVDREIWQLLGSQPMMNSVG
jgi:hypothetical protein